LSPALGLAQELRLTLAPVEPGPKAGAPPAPAYSLPQTKAWPREALPGKTSMMDELEQDIDKAAEMLRQAKAVVALTGAGVSAESGVPTFRGKEGLWEKFDPSTLEIGNFMKNPLRTWQVLRALFEGSLGQVRPNAAHEFLARLETQGKLLGIVTQNIDGLHQKAGSRVVHEFHGSMEWLVAPRSGHRYLAKDFDLGQLPPICPKSGEALKPDFVFFGEAIPAAAIRGAQELLTRADLLLVVGTAGVVWPASELPRLAKLGGARIIEINPESAMTRELGINDLWLRGPAGELCARLSEKLWP